MPPRPEEVYALAKRQGMDFVTITDHDTIAGAQAIAHLPGTFISEELTVAFKGEPQAVHVLCYGITPDDHEWLQAHNDDVEACAEYLHGNEITAALAHPFYAVGAPLTARHRRRLAELFPIWETRNGSRAKELNLPAFVYIETHGGTAIGGSDDHAGIDIGAPSPRRRRPATPAEFLAHVRAGRAGAHGAQGSAAKWAHAAMALAVRSSRRRGATARRRPEPGAVLKIVERVMREGDVRSGQVGADLGPEDARALLRAWLAGMDLRLDEHRLLAAAPGRRAGPPRSLPPRPPDPRAQAGRRGGQRWWAMTTTPARSTSRARRAPLFDACLPAIPYAAATAFLGREKSKLTRTRVTGRAWPWSPTASAAMHGVTHTHPADPRAGRARLRGRGDRHRRRRRPPPERGGRDRDPLLPGPDDRRADAAGPGRGAGRRPLRPRPRLLTGPGRDRRLAAGPGAGAAGPRQLPHRAGRLRRAAHGPGQLEAHRRSRAGRLLRRLRRGPLPQPGQRRAPGRAGDRRRVGSAAGTAASTSSASTRRLRSPAPSPARSTSSTPGA